ncbi:SpoIIE family protein phosphatase [Streptomyces tateyamensis]|uniref:SpoIIE family protein phosphatase n=1 Tax=Streptomyces tateyamensis TaxID=565073 RepID=UPI00269F8A85
MRHRAGGADLGRPGSQGERLLLYTDGVGETRDGQGTFYPLLPRLEQWTGAPGGRLLELLRTDLHAYGQSSKDDIAALLVTRRTEHRAAG